MYSSDPAADYAAHDREVQKWLDRLPHCAHCHEPIQEKSYFRIEEANICSDCLHDYCEEHYKTENVELNR